MRIAKDERRKGSEKRFIQSPSEMINNAQDDLPLLKSTKNVAVSKKGKRKTKKSGGERGRSVTPTSRPDEGAGKERERKESEKARARPVA